MVVLCDYFGLLTLGSCGTTILVSSGAVNESSFPVIFCGCLMGTCTKIVWNAPELGFVFGFGNYTHNGHYYLCLLVIMFLMEVVHLEGGLIFMFCINVIGGHGFVGGSLLISVSFLVQFM